MFLLIRQVELVKSITFGNYEYLENTKCRPQHFQTENYVNKIPRARRLGFKLRLH